MFHETWIGVECGAPWKDRAIGALQRHCVLDAVRVLQPVATHTTNPAWRALLARHGVNAEILPLFGLVPIAQNPETPWLAATLAAAGIEITAPERDRWWILAIFGSLHPAWSPEPFLTYLRAAARAAGRKVAIVSVGRINAGIAQWDSMTAQDAGPDLLFCRLGEQSPERLSTLLQTADFGIATTPWSIIGKSATVSTMVDHGLPTLVTRDELRFPFAIEQEPQPSPLLCKMTAGLPSVLPTLHRGQPASRLPEIARQLLEALESSTPLPDTSQNP